MENLTLKQIRLIKEFSQEKMAELLEVHTNTYAIWEKTPSKISIENCYRICEILGVEYDAHIFLP